jgi:hypothetical protein
MPRRWFGHLDDFSTNQFETAIRWEDAGSFDPFQFLDREEFLRHCFRDHMPIILPLPAPVTSHSAKQFRNRCEFYRFISIRKQCREKSAARAIKYPVNPRQKWCWPKPLVELRNLLTATA